ncbi:hypothetical protein SK128_026595 [Halocaridina rubra]|uniref:Uncharacterized protein n=1 Tax=Halocaridina rubra TaxID=373956 RepID=A0AAN9AA89_HALRR
MGVTDWGVKWGVVFVGGIAGTQLGKHDGDRVCEDSSPVSPCLYASHMIVILMGAIEVRRTLFEEECERWSESRATSKVTRKRAGAVLADPVDASTPSLLSCQSPDKKRIHGKCTKPGLPQSGQAKVPGNEKGEIASPSSLPLGGLGKLKSSKK